MSNESYKAGIRYVFGLVEEHLKNEDDEFIKGLLENLVDSSGKHEKMESVIFILKDQQESQKILSYIISNRMTAGAISTDRKVSNIIYKFNIEEKMRTIFYKDMNKGDFRYLSIIIDVLTDEKIKEISMNRKPYLEMIKKSLESSKEIQSSLLSRELGLCLG
ncbi:hypothetical protein [Clostridium gasigenes]|uniref:Uncharacterized protein n=1 Tax=Clostridium gasigenes TaxID=94869 RepID=A0A1H0N2E1_9CLOT|nr:hypothetical protein [Clostridium gasigenes]SDO86781.1 hypothetical protein SAMN04488529_101657 [Clostridium gasigenes]